MKNSKTVIANNEVSNVETTNVNNEVTELATVETPQENKGRLIKLVSATDQIFGMNENTRPVFAVIEDILTVEGKNETFQIDGYNEETEYSFGTFGNLYNQVKIYPSCFFYGSKEIATSPIFVADAFGIPMAIAEKIFVESCEPVFAQLQTVSEDELPKTVLSVIEKMKNDGFSESSIKKLFSFQKGRFDNIFRPTEKATPTKIYLGSFNAEKNIEVKFIFEKESDKKSVPFKNFTELEKAFKDQMSDGHKKLSDYCKEVASGYNATSTVQLVVNVIKIAELSEEMI